MYASIVKPLFDRLAAAVLLILTGPIILLVAGLMLLTNERKIWFIQLRPGFRGKPFKMIKFRTMTEALDPSGAPLPDHSRLTAIGKTIRKLSIDELPQLINVIKGEMSIIGPRPLLMEYMPLYNEQQNKRHLVRPGITGWAQINGRNTLTWSQKFSYDSWYVENLSFWLDIKILFLTVGKVFKAEGVNSSPKETMEKFRGNS